jgi:hypothetical protein
VDLHRQQVKEKERGKMMRTAKNKLIMAGILFLALGISSTDGRAEPVLVNGSFETGDYTGWVLREEGGLGATDGTWGITQDGQTVNRSGQVYDFFDQINVSQNSINLPRTYQATDGIYLAIQLQNGGQDHRMYQDVTLPEGATTLSWDMFYENMNPFFSNNQYLAIHIRNLDDTIQETLFITDDTSPLSIPMSQFSFDISPFAGSTIRIDVEMKVYLHFFDAGFDNFRIQVSEVQESPSASTGPPGWSRGNGKKPVWNLQSMNKPKGFNQGLKKGWQKEQ